MVWSNRERQNQFVLDKRFDIQQRIRHKVFDIASATFRLERIHGLELCSVIKQAQGRVHMQRQIKRRKTPLTHDPHHPLRPDVQPPPVTTPRIDPPIQLPLKATGLIFGQPLAKTHT
ncbi:MAG TPA: hypothetical protein VF285_08265 [Castellaniella sp.]